MALHALGPLASLGAKRSSLGRMAVNCCGVGEDIEDMGYGGNYTRNMNANDKNKRVGG